VKTQNGRIIAQLAMERTTWDSVNWLAMIVYSGPLDDTHNLIQFFRREAPRLRILRRLIVSKDKTVVLDVNRDSIEFPGLTFDSPALSRLLDDLGVVYSHDRLKEAKATNSVMEFGLGAVWCWGHDSVS
jgi:hypothetical protein